MVCPLWPHRKLERRFNKYEIYGYDSDLTRRKANIQKYMDIWDFLTVEPKPPNNDKDIPKSKP